MSARLSLASPAGSLQKSALRKELINQPDFVFTSLRPTNKFVCVVLQKQKDADNIDISLLRFIFAEREGLRYYFSIFSPLLYVSHTANNTLHDGILG